MKCPNCHFPDLQNLNNKYLKCLECGYKEQIETKLINEMEKHFQGEKNVAAEKE